jgi:WD40 repeat protein
MANDGESGGAAFNHRGDLMINATWNRINLWRPGVKLLLSASNEPPTALHPIFHGVGNGGPLDFDAEDNSLSRILWGEPQPQLEIDAISSAPEVVSFQSQPCSFNWATFALDQNGKLGALSRSNAVHLVDVETGVELAKLPVPGVHEPLFLPGRRGLVVSSEHGISVFPFITNTGGDITICGPSMLQAEGDFTRLRLGPEGRNLTAWGEERLQIYSLPSLEKLARIKNPLDRHDLLGPSFDRDEKLLAWGRWNSSYVNIWDLEAQKLSHRIKLTHSGGVTSGRPEFTPDGKWLVVCSQVDLRLYEPGTWELRGSIPWKSGANPFTLLGEGQIAAVSTPGSGVGVHLLRLPDFKELAVLDAPADRPNTHLGTSADGLKLFAIRDDGAISVWNLPLIAAGLAGLGLDWEAPLPGPDRLDPSAAPRLKLRKPGESE